VEQFPGAALWKRAAIARCGPVGGSVEACSKMNNDLPESAKNEYYFACHREKLNSLPVQKHGYGHGT
jgi:hypothetical protein